jgi:hypothetical protein
MEIRAARDTRNGREEARLNPGEHGGIRADAHGERSGDDGREAWCAPDRADALPQVADELSEDRRHGQ